MDETGTRETVRTLAARMAPVPPQGGPLTGETRLIEDLGYDSLHLMMLITEVFDALALEMPGPDDVVQFEGLESVQDAEDLVVRLLREESRAA